VLDEEVLRKTNRIIANIDTPNIGFCRQAIIVAGHIIHYRSVFCVLASNTSAKQSPGYQVE